MIRCNSRLFGNAWATATKKFWIAAVLVSLTGGTARAQSIAVHWNSYGGNDTSNVPAATADGIKLPDGTYNANWTNLSVNWYTGGTTNLPDSTGAATTVAVSTNNASNAGTYWYDGSYTSTDPLLNGPWGANGNPIPNVITGIPYASYEIIGYTNPPYGSNDYTCWLDSNPSAPNASNAPVAGSQYYYSPQSGNGSGLGNSGDFVLMTNNTSSSNFPAQNTVVWSGLTGANQTLWDDSVPNGQNNYGFTGFEIVNTSLAGVVWSGSNSSNWNTASNWVGGVLPLSGGTVTFGAANANPSVNLGNSNQTVGGIVFTSNVNTTIASSGANTLFLDNTGGTGGTAPATVSVQGGMHAINSAVGLNSNATLTLTSGQLTIGANVANGVNGSAGLTVAAGGGILILAGSNTYSGPTNIAGATTNVTGTLGNTPVNVSAGLLSLQNARAVSQNTLSVSGGTLNQTVGNAISGTTVLALSGGVTTLSQSNSYSGGTTVGNSALLLATNANGSATGTSGVTVNSGGTLGGSGFVGSTVSVNAGGAVAPAGNSTGFSTLNLTNLSIPSGGNLNFNISAGTNDQVLVFNNLTLGGNVNFNVAFPAGLAAGTFQLLGEGSGTTSDTSTINVFGTPAETYTVLKPGQGGNSTTYYELQTTVLSTTWNGNSGAWDTTSNNWTGPAGTKYISGQPVIFTDAASGTVSIANTVTPQSVTFSNNANTYTLTGAAGIGGAATLALTGTGTVILAESNSYTGGTSIGPGATLQIGAGGISGSIAAASAISNSGTLVISRSDNATSNAQDWVNGVTGNQRSSYILGSTISGSGGITINGGGYLQLTSTNNSFTGQISIKDGYLAVNNTANLGNSTSILIGDTGGTMNAGIFNNNTNTPTGNLLIPQNIHVQAGSSGAAFIAGQTANTFTTTYSGSIQVDKTTNIEPGFWGGVLLTGPISGAGGLNLYTSNRGSGDTFMNTSETFQGNVNIGSDDTTFQNNQGGPNANFVVYWKYNPATNAAVNTGFGQGTITTQNNQGLDFFVTVGSGAGTNTATLTNPINVLATGGVLFGDTANSGMQVAFSGPVSLAGQLVIGVDQGNGASVAEPINYAGQVILDRSAADQPGFELTKQSNNLGGNFPMGAVSISGNIVDGSNGSFANPLYLASTYFLNPQSSLILNITGTANTYTTGTAVASGLSNVAANSSLGSGAAVVEPGAALRLNAVASVPGSVLVTSNGAANGILSLGADFDPAGIINSTSKGVLAVDASIATPLNLANEGNGMMSLGSVSGGTYSGATLGTNSDGNYHLGGGGGVLTFASNVLTGSNSVIVGTGVGGNSNNTPFGMSNGGGTIKLAANQSTTGAIVVNGGIVNNGGNNQYTSSTLELVVQPGAGGGQPLGTGNNNVSLIGGTVQYDLPNTGGVGASVSMGNLAVNGGPSVVTFTNANYGNTLTIAGTNGIVRNNNAALGIGFAYPGIGALGSATGGVQVLVPNAIGAGAIGNIIPAGNAGTNGMVSVGGVVAPWITYFDSQNHTAGGDFLAYTAAGFVATTYTVNGVPGSLTEAAGSQLANTVPSDIVEIVNSASANDASMSTNTTIYALKTVKQSGQLNITSSGAAPVALSITSGGLSVDEQNGQCTIGSGTANSAVNLVFGTSASPVEAVIWTGMYNGKTTLNVMNNVTAAALTTTGYGNLVLLNNSATSSATANSISGPVTINTGTVTTTNEYNLGAGTGSNNVVLNGGQWAANGGGTLSAHNIFMGPAGGILSINANTNFAASISDLGGQPSGVSAGPLTLLVSSNNNNYALTLSNASPSANQWSGGTIVEGNGTSGQVIVNPGVNLGTGDVTVNQATLVLGGNNLGANANLNVAAGAAVIFQSTSITPTIDGLAGFGSVVLGSSGAAPTLTVGGNNASTRFDGTISQNVGSGGAGLTKTGTGTLTLTGASNTFTGALTVNEGVLEVTKLENNLNGTGPITLGGSGPATLRFIGSNDFTSRTFNLVGDATLDASETSTDPNNNLYLSGQVNGNGHNLTLSGLSAVGGEIDSVINLSGGSLTKNGNGTWLLDSHPNTIAGTTVNAGTLYVDSNSTGSGPIVLNGGLLASVPGSVTLNGLLSAGSGAHQIAPGGIGAIGTLNDASNVSLNANTTLDIDLASAGASDELAVAGALTASGAADVNLATIGALTAGSTYTIAAFGSDPSLTAANFTAVGSTQAGYGLEIVGNSLLYAPGFGTHGLWKQPVSGSWNVGSNWDDGEIPSGGSIVFSGSPSATATVTLDGNQTAGSITFSPSGSYGYALTQGSAGALTLNNSGSVAAIRVTGTNSISAPLSLASSLSVTANSGGELTISGSIGQATSGQSLLLTGDGTGTLILSGSSNSFTGGTTVANGTLILESAGALAEGSSLTVGNASAFAGVIPDAAVAPAAIAPVPEPGTLALLASGALLLMFHRRRTDRGAKACPAWNSAAGISPTSPDLNPSRA